MLIPKIPSNFTVVCGPCYLIGYFGSTAILVFGVYFEDALLKNLTKGWIKGYSRYSHQELCWGATMLQNQSCWCLSSRVCQASPPVYEVLKYAEAWDVCRLCLSFQTRRRHLHATRMFEHMCFHTCLWDRLAFWGYWLWKITLLDHSNVINCLRFLNFLILNSILQSSNSPAFQFNCRSTKVYLGFQGKWRAMLYWAPWNPW